MIYLLSLIALGLLVRTLMPRLIGMQPLGDTARNVSFFAVMALLIIIVGQLQSWNVALALLNLCLISAIMALGVNIQWGYAGLLNVGIMGFAALGGVAAVIVSVDPVSDAWSAGALGVFVAFIIAVVAVMAATYVYRAMDKSHKRTVIVATIVIGAFSYPALSMALQRPLLKRSILLHLAFLVALACQSCFPGPSMAYLLPVWPG